MGHPPPPPTMTNSRTLPSLVSANPNHTTYPNPYLTALHVYSTCFIVTCVLVLCFSCGEDYIGEYCQDDNPCNNLCMNHGTCRIHDPDTSPRAECICPIGKYFTDYIYMSFSQSCLFSQPTCGCVLVLL